MSRLPSFNDFMIFFNDNADIVDYDIQRFAPQQLKEPRNPFSKEEYVLLAKTCMTMVLAFLAQYHAWLCEQLDKAEDSK